MLINSPQPKNSMRYMLKIVAAVLTAPEPTLRPKNCGLSRRRKVATALASRTAKVVVFIPPAVEPGEPPTSISKIIMARDASVIAVRSMVLKPAVLGETAWKKEARSRFPMGSAE